MDKNWAGIAVVSVVFAVVAFYLNPTKVHERASQFNDKLKVAQSLLNHTHEFNKPELIQVTDHVYTAIGFGLANSALIVGPRGAVVVDAMESIPAGRDVRTEFEKVAPGVPISAIIYTHNHADHTLGARAFAEEGTEVWAHATTIMYLDRILSQTGEITYRRGMRQFGVYLNKEEGFVNSGIGPHLRFDPSGAVAGLIYPTHVFEGDRKTISVAGVELELIHCPGETNDQIAVWYPAQRVLFAADNFYRAFPNIYAIRGTPSRDAMLWVRSLDRMIELGADHLVLGHTRPLSGRDVIRASLTLYRDAIQFVHDQTLRHMNKGVYLDDIIEKVRLPAHLEEYDWLQPFYGTVEWAVRAVFTHYLGWFSGDPVQLRPLTPAQRAQRMADLVGGVDALESAAMKAFAKADECTDVNEEQQALQWALELFSAARRLKDTKAVKEAYVRVLRRLGALQPSATGRNYYLTSAKEAAGDLTLSTERQKSSVHHVRAMSHILVLMSGRLDPEKAGVETLTSLLFVFPDTNERVRLTVRNGVCIVKDVESSTELNLEEDDIVVSVDAKVFKEIIANERSAATAYASGALKVLRGTILAFKAFLDWFDRA
eukprot:CAMPEP_0177639248 /NCGR_PEP_ID=MMETSP0447-20121125/5921_1 /TAXON_ID=0 /ORGANISM="Stygamoeba regulata, Strain BSH-02190019" /LENGTH=599 /DNA_ID=CAMNT_0019141265 /DNA_START=35 /DNA_END=1834 /DNA_ORIENTATION=+